MNYYRTPRTFYVAWDTRNSFLRTKKRGMLLIGYAIRIPRRIHIMEHHPN